MGVLWAWVTGSGPSPAWIARVAKPLPCVRSRIAASLGWRPGPFPRRLTGAALVSAKATAVVAIAARLRFGDGGIRGSARTDLDPGGAAGVRGLRETAVARGARRAVRSRRVAPVARRPWPCRAVRGRDPGVRGVVSCLPALPAGARPVPRRGVRQRVRLGRRERARRRLRPATHRAEPL